MLVLYKIPTVSILSHKYDGGELSFTRSCWERTLILFSSPPVKYDIANAVTPKNGNQPGEIAPNSQLYPSRYHQIIIIPSFCPPLLERLAGEGGQDEAGLVDVRVVVAELRVLLLGGEAAERGLHVAGGVLGADHEADLAGGVGGDGGVGVLDGREDLLAVLLKLGDQWQVEPLVLSYFVSVSIVKWMRGVPRLAELKW